jgi:hypothetical protein
MTAEEKEAIRLTELPRLTLNLCEKLDAIGITTLLDLLRTSWQVLRKKGFDFHELLDISDTLFRLRYTFLASSESLVRGLAIRWEKLPCSTPVEEVFSPETAMQLQELGVTTIGHVISSPQTKKLNKIGLILRKDYARTVLPCSRPTVPVT